MNLDHWWYRDHGLSRLLLPLSALYCAVVRLRRRAYQTGWLEIIPPPVPLVVVGNLTVGGSGKTPLVLWLVEFFRAQGLRPGVVSRGYGGKSKKYPLAVTATTDPALCGDEPLLIARRAGCPVVVSPRRPEGAAWLAAHGCDVIVADDGLQHYRLGRTLEFVVVDGARGFGNRRCLPAGPLREPLSRLATVDGVVVKGGGGDGVAMILEATELVSLADATCRQPLTQWRGATVHAVAGIGHPESFFHTLREAGLSVIPHPFPDHHRFQPADLAFAEDYPILLTEKDAVKCQAFVTERGWMLPVTARLPEPFGPALLERMKLNATTDTPGNPEHGSG